MLNINFSPWPLFTKEEADTVQKVLLSNCVNYWTGQEGREFEKEFATWSGTKYAIALMNGTVALDVALKVLEISEGDEVIVTPRTFLASVSSIVNCGAIPVFADVDPDSQNISVDTIKLVITEKTRAIICVHLAGCPCDMGKIMSLARKLNLKVIEDCAQAHGAKYKNQSVGTFGDVGCWSFCQDKIMTTGGEGGMVTTNSKVLWSKMWSYKDHGKSWEAVYEREHPQGFRWVHDSFGTNWRMTEMQAAIGRIQLTRMPGWHEARKQNARSILTACREWDVALRVPSLPDYVEHAWYKCYVFIRQEGLRSGWSRDRIIEEINNRGVPCFQGSCSEVYLERAFESTKWRPVERLSVAKQLGETSLMFLVHPSLTKDEVSRTRRAIKKVLSLASKN